MDRSRQLAPLFGIVSCLLVLGALAVPYTLEDAAIVRLYYGSGVLNPLVAGLLALLSIVVFAAGRQGRTDPALAAGVTLSLGLFIVGVTVAWALTIQFGIVGASLSDHRWLLSGVALGVPLTAAWYAYSLGLLTAGDAKGP